MLPRYHLLAYLTAILGLVAHVGIAEAGWVTFKNDTNKAIVVQEFIIVNGKKIGGKPTRLQPGESFREFQNTPGIKNYEVLDAANVAVSLWCSQLDCRALSQSYSITTGQGKVLVIPLPEPKKP